MPPPSYSVRALPVRRNWLLSISQRVIAVEQARPKVDLPAHRPAGAGVAAKEQRLAGGIEQVGRLRRDLVAGMQAPEVRDVAVLVVGIVLVDQPLLELPVPSDLVGCDARAHLFQLPAQVRIDVQDGAGLDGVGEQVADDLVIHRRAGRRARRSRASWRGARSASLSLGPLVKVSTKKRAASRRMG